MVPKLFLYQIHWRKKRKEIESPQLCTQLLLAIIEDALLGWTLLCSFFLLGPYPGSKDTEHVRSLKMHRTEFPCLSTHSSGPQEVLPFPNASKSNRALHELGFFPYLRACGHLAEGRKKSKAFGSKKSACIKGPLLLMFWTNICAPPGIPFPLSFCNCVPHHTPLYTSPSGFSRLFLFFFFGLELDLCPQSVWRFSYPLI